MLGIPTETIAEHQNTIDVTRRCKPDQIQLNIFCPYPGTDLYKYCLENKIITGEVKDRGRNKAGMDLPGFSKKQIQKRYDNFLANVYADNMVHLLILKGLFFIAYRFKCGMAFELAKNIAQMLKMDKPDCYKSVLPTKKNLDLAKYPSSDKSFHG